MMTDGKGNTGVPKRKARGVRWTDAKIIIKKGRDWDVRVCLEGRKGDRPAYRGVGAWGKGFFRVGGSNRPGHGGATDALEITGCG